MHHRFSVVLTASALVFAACDGSEPGADSPCGAAGCDVATCGDGACDTGEGCTTCASDCGSCAPTCGDGACEAGEGCTTCAADCGTCDGACVSADAPAPGTQTWTVHSGGVARSVRVHVPPGYDHRQPTPVVLGFHGLGSNAGQQAALSRMDAKSDAAGFLAIYPEGTGDTPSWNAGACCGEATQQDVADVAFVRDLVAIARERLCVDDDRVFATGMSNGGFLSHRLACELADRVAAVAPVAGVIGVTSCSPSRPVSVMHFHGTADTLVPYTGSPLLGFPGVMTTATEWAVRNGCDATPASESVAPDVRCDTWSGCDAGTEVTLCTVEGGGHTWPGGTPLPFGVTSGYSATDAMWEFFLRHPRT